LKDLASRNALDQGAQVEFEGRKYPDYVSMGVAYAKLVAAQRIPSCRYMVQAAKRFLRMYEEAHSGSAGFYWCDASAIEPCAFIERLPHVKGDLAGDTVVLEPWQMWVVIAVYGFRVVSANKRENGARLVRTVMLEVPRKNGKSFLTAGISLYELCVNAKHGDDLFIIAPTANQAQKVLEPMREMVKIQPALESHYGITATSQKLNVGETNSYALVLTSQGKHQDGHDPKVVVADEFHSVPVDIFKVMKSAQGARPEALFIQIGTAGYNAFGPGWDQRQEATRVLEGELRRDRLFAAIWTVDQEDMAHLDREIAIRKANPCYGVSLIEGAVAEEMLDLHGRDPVKKAELLRTRFNIWGMGEQKLIPRDAWEACKDIALSMDDFTGERAWIGVDLATRNDMVAWVIEFVLDGKVAFFARHYVPEFGPWREDEELRDYYQQWHEDGWLEFTPGSHHTYEELETDLLDLCDKFKVEAIAIDDREANALMAALAKKGKPVLSFRKNAPNYSEPTKDVIARAVGKFKGLVHQGDPVFAWCVDNVIGGINTAGLILPKKVSEHSPLKIDSFDAMVQAHALALEHADMSKIRRPSPMVTRGLRMVDV